MNYLNPSKHNCGLTKKFTKPDTITQTLDNMAWSNYKLLQPGHNLLKKIAIAYLHYADTKHSDWMFQGIQLFQPIRLHYFSIVYLCLADICWWHQLLSTITEYLHSSDVTSGQSYYWAPPPDFVYICLSVIRFSNKWQLLITTRLSATNVFQIYSLGGNYLQLDKLDSFTALK